MILANVAEDLFRSILQGVPPGAVFALIALGFVLTYKTSGVFNLAFGAQAYISAAMYFHAVNEWGWHRAPAVVLAVFVIESLQPDPPPGPRSNTDDVLELRLGTTEGAPDGE